MGVKKLKPTSPGRRFQTVSDFDTVTKATPEKSLLASRLVEATWRLLTPAHRREVALFFREHPVPSGERALRQSLERFDWYRGFRRDAARELTAWLESHP